MFFLKGTFVYIVEDERNHTVKGSVIDCQIIRWRRKDPKNPGFLFTTNLAKINIYQFFFALLYYHCGYSINMTEFFLSVVLERQDFLGSIKSAATFFVPCNSSTTTVR